MPNQEPEILSVSALNRLIQKRLESFPRLAVMGEVENFRPASSGHVYFTLKDKESAISCVVWRSTRQRLKVQPEAGQEVVLIGRLSLYAPRGTYSFVVERIDLHGEGLLLKKLEALKAKLKNEGLFDPDKKQDLPLLPKKVGVIAGEASAAWADIQKIRQQKWPAYPTIFKPCLVQGEGAAPDLIRALKELDQDPEVEVILLSRGGGSVQDLMAFNDESLAKCLFKMKTPVVSAVGHEIDLSITDLVADHQAPTPTAGSDLVFPDRQELTDQLKFWQRRLQDFSQDLNERLRGDVKHLAKRLQAFRPRQLLEKRRQNLQLNQKRLEQTLKQSCQLKIQHIDALRRVLFGFSLDKALLYRQQHLISLKKRIRTAMTEAYRSQSDKSARLQSQLEALSPLKTLERGYALLLSDSAESLKKPRPGDEVQIHSRKWRMKAHLTEVKPQDHPGLIK